MSVSKSKKAVDPSDVSFNAHAIAGAWEAADELPVCVAVAIANEFTDHAPAARNGEQSDRDVLFSDAEIMVEEKAVGVCDREVAERYAPRYVELNRRDNKVLAVNPAQVFGGYPQ